MWTSQSLNSSHGLPSSDNSQLSGGSGSGRGQVHSLEDQHDPSNIRGAGKQDPSISRSISGPSIPGYNNNSSTGAPPTSGGVAGGRRAVRGYQFRRNQLHKAKTSKPTVTEHDSWTEQEVNIEPPSPVAVAMETRPPVHGGTGSISSAHSGLKVNTTLPIVRHRSVKEYSSTTPDREKSRPLSAVEPHLVHHSSLLVQPPSSQKPQLQFRSVESPEPPLFTTMTAVTAGGEEEVFREVNIEEAIARSQGNALGVNSQDETSHFKARRHVSHVYSSVIVY